MKLHKAVKKMLDGYAIRREDWINCRLEYHSDERTWFIADGCSTAVEYTFEVFDFYTEWEVVGSN